jgi:hypothetical protein
LNENLHSPLKSCLKVKKYASRKGHERGVVAVAHEMLRIAFFMLKRMEPYRGGDSGLSVRKFKRLKCKAVVGLQG